jgi:hypothetical protein
MESAEGTRDALVELPAHPIARHEAGRDQEQRCATTI